MATYDLTTSIPNANDLRDGDIINCPYSGDYKMIKLPKGIYKLEVWGAQGGYRSSSSYGGKGGYSYGTLTLMNKAKTKLYLYAGGSGNSGTRDSSTSIYSGGFNGGGYRYNYPGGGGGSDIRIGTDSLYARVIVAGGGASDGASSYGGGAGGGTSGIAGTSTYGTNYGVGSQTSSGSKTLSSQVTTNGSSVGGGFGFGGFGVYRSSGYGGAGGGGWYGGSGTYPDGSGDDDSAGSGGSGYVYTSSTYGNYPSGCLLDSNYYLTDASTAAGNTSFTDPDTGSSTTGRAGNGYVRITCIEIFSATYKKTNGIWEKLYQDGLSVLTANPDALIKKFVKGDFKWSSVSTLPYEFYNGSAVVLNDEIHILGGSDSNNNTNHYKYNTSTNTWSSVSTLPYAFYKNMVVLNGEIHLMGGDNGTNVNKNVTHYKYSPTNGTWTKLKTNLPYDFNGVSIVYNNEIHIFSGMANSNKYHYKFDGSTWSSVSELPYYFNTGSAVVLNNEIHILSGGSDVSSGTSNYRTNHYKYNPSTNTWSEVSTLPYEFPNGSAVVYNNEIHILGSGYYKYDYRVYSNGNKYYYYTFPYRFYHYKFNNDTNTWSSVSTLPYEFSNSNSAIVLDNEIHILGSKYSTSYGSNWEINYRTYPKSKCHYKYHGTWVPEY